MDKYYNSIAQSYDELHLAEQLQKIKLARDLINSDTNLTLESDSIILDLGCGTGISTDIFELPRFGLDPSLELLRIASSKRTLLTGKTNDSSNDNVMFSSKNKYSNHFGFILGQAEHIPIKDKTVNIVTSITSIHNFNNIEQSLQEISRIVIDRVLITILKKSSKFKDIVAKIKAYFKIINNKDNEFDLLLYLEPKRLNSSIFNSKNNK